MFDHRISIATETHYSSAPLRLRVKSYPERRITSVIRGAKAGVGSVDKLAPVPGVYNDPEWLDLSGLLGRSGWGT